MAKDKNLGKCLFQRQNSRGQSGTEKELETGRLMQGGVAENRSITEANPGENCNKRVPSRSLKVNLQNSASVCCGKGHIARAGESTGVDSSSQSVDGKGRETRSVYVKEKQS